MNKVEQIRKSIKDYEYALRHEMQEKLSAFQHAKEQEIERIQSTCTHSSTEKVSGNIWYPYDFIQCLDCDLELKRGIKHVQGSCFDGPPDRVLHRGN